MSHAADELWMRRALEIAERGRGHVEPNPLVGAVLVRDGNVVGEGWHQRFGEAHAEVNALQAAGEAARGATLYVTLEPCCHHGKTPPCTDALIQAGIARVVAALADPFPLVATQGVAQLHAAGIAVEIGLCDAEARRQNAPYLKLIHTGRPYVLAKWAMSLDGKIATRTGDSKWISNEASRRKVHELRGRVDGILVGIGTVLVDDPLLTARPAGPRIASRIVLDSKARLPLAAQLVRTAKTVPTIVVVSSSAPAERVDALRDAGCEVLLPSPEHDGAARMPALLDELGKRRWTNLLVEGGSDVLGRFLDVDAIDEVHVFLAPRLIGGSQGKTPFAGRGVETLAHAWNLSAWHVEMLEGDVYLRGWK
ncbi:MAG: bifunctional diaminohydroxyphosphoribosylaminopyrimidine deaminase/5-amino-6-(5-phosphoribosylamino)uracil reductase RibD [Gemmataceae bacterium]|nr:bifunctional diaminohydroxyphosphoribosylaminopyrimidine deaminase/5-amino-6-(5-phosphoribosylamino)uracil reductase RibD [Gemmataceae bacterium]